MIKLKAKNDTERRVLDYLSSNASETIEKFWGNTPGVWVRIEELTQK